MPISRVRSVTLTSMMFMITMPPTTSEMQRHRHHDGRDHPQQLVDEAADRVRREGVEIVGLARARVEAGAQRHARHIERLLHGQAAAWPGPAEERDRLPGPEHPVEGGNGI